MSNENNPCKGIKRQPLSIDGWRFYTADFSVQASHDNEWMGNVRLMRSPEQVELWGKLPDEIIDSGDCPLFITGRGYTFNEALQDAEQRASKYSLLHKEVIS
jgi:hypothetical protein